MFCKDADFQETALGRIPREWYIKKAEELGEVVTGITPSTYIKEYWNGDYPFVTPTDMTDSKYVEKTERKVTAKGLEEGRLVPRDSVLVTCIASIGKMALAFEDCLTNQQINTIICMKEMNPHYVYYALRFRSDILKSWAGRTTNPIIKKSMFEKFPIPIPKNYLEQAKIAEVLSCVDLAILKTNEVIAKTERLKKGLMQQLLTRGIEHREYKYSKELGHKIPKEWQVAKAGGICESIVPGRNKPKKFDGEIPWITLPDIDGIYIGSSKSGLKVSEEEVKKCGGKIVPSNSVVMSCIGKFGIVAITTRDIVINQQLHAFTCPKELDPYFLAISLMSQVNYMRSISATTVIPYMNKTNCNSVPIPLPSTNEQQKIADVLSSVEKKLELEKKEKAKLERVKRGLMDLLLTGKVRVKVD